ncbi:ThiF family adenylyltransferase, partial [Streptomyces olivaceus]
MHPMVKPALRRGWRDLNTVQFGMTPAHALTLAPVDRATGGFLELLNGTRGPALLREEGHRMDLPEGHVDRVVERLAEAGLLDDSRGGGPAAEALREKKDVLDRLRPDLATLSLTTSAPRRAFRHQPAPGAHARGGRGGRRGDRGPAGGRVAPCLGGRLMQQVLTAVVERHRPVWPDPVDSAHY